MCNFFLQMNNLKKILQMMVDYYNEVSRSTDLKPFMSGSILSLSPVTVVWRDGARRSVL